MSPSRTVNCIICGAQFTTGYPTKLTCSARCRELRRNQVQVQYHAKCVTPSWRTSSREGVREICHTIYESLPARYDELKVLVLRAGHKLEDGTLSNMIMKMKRCGDIELDRETKTWKRTVHK